MKRTIRRESPTSAAADMAPNARVVLMTADGGSIDITDAAGDLLILLRGTGCPPSVALLCRHLGRCGGGCTTTTAATTAPAALEAPGQLTGRESQVVAHVRQGFTNKEIARRLGIQEDTVKKHLQAVFGKLGVRRRALVALSGRAMPLPSAP